MYQILGIVNIVLLIGVTAPYWLRRLNQQFFKGKKAALTKWAKRLRRVHKPLGLGLILLSLLHGYLALGAFRLHTGTLVGLMIFITAMLGGLFFRKKKAVFLIWHKRAALMTILLTLLHLLAPNALWLLLR